MSGIGIIKIPKVDAERLPNRTLPIPGEDDGFITGLEVYHQLHCLASRTHFSSTIFMCKMSSANL